MPETDPKSCDFTYLIAIEAPAEKAGLPGGCVEVAVPASTWAIFPCLGPAGPAIQGTWPRIMGEWFPSSGYERVEAPDLEVYLSEDASKADSRSEIWVPVRKA